MPDRFKFSFGYIAPRSRFAQQDLSLVINLNHLSDDNSIQIPVRGKKPDPSLHKAPEPEKDYCSLNNLFNLMGLGDLQSMENLIEKHLFRIRYWEYRNRQDKVVRKKVDPSIERELKEKLTTDEANL